jgi:predicted ribosomally synthesized peptide with SipW-like signal peptide
MKNSKFIALSLLLALMLMGAGFAAWTNQLKIGNTVTTGNLNVDFTSASIVDAEYNQNDTSHPFKNYVDSQISNDNKSVSVKVGNLYPGSGALYSTRFDNNGSIPAVISDVNIDFKKESDSLNDQLLIAGGFIHYNKAGAVQDDYNYFVCKLDDFEENMNKILSGIRLEPNDYVTLDIHDSFTNAIKVKIPMYDKSLNKKCIVFYLPTGADESTESQETIFDIKLNFKQHNVE